MPRAAPPPGPPWDLPLIDAPLAFVDLEMTGLDVQIDRVVEICIVRVRGDVVEGVVDTLVAPGERAGGNAHIHGLDEAALDGAPSFASIADQVEALLDGAVLVAHASEWDVRFLNMEMARAGRTTPIEFALDTLVLSRRAFSLPSHSLDALCKHFGIDRSRAHRARPDVEAMRVVFAKEVEVLSPVNVRDLWEVRIAERRARAAIVATCQELVGTGKPVRIVYRPSRRGAEEMHVVVTEVRAELDPPRVIGYQLPGRGRAELRADRILQVHTDEEREPERPPTHPAVGGDRER